MKGTVIIGVVLIILGVAALVYQGITYTSRTDRLNIGPLHATAEKKETIPIPQVLGWITVAGGVVLVVVGARSR